MNIIAVVLSLNVILAIVVAMT
jgi:hypothetical protein